MRLLFIWPSKEIKISIGSVFSKMYELNGITSVPVILRTAASMVKDDHDIYIINENWNKINFEDEHEIVFIAAYSFNINRAYEIAKKFKVKNKKTVLCGWHPTALPEEAKKCCDAVIIGEPALSIQFLLNDVEMRKIKPFYKSVPTDPLILPTPYISKSESVVFGARIQATRGCSNRCDFCGIPSIEANKLLKRPTKDVKNDMESINCKSFVLVDNALTTDTNYTKELFKKIKEVNKKFVCYGGINVLNSDEELLKLASEAGCTTWLVGFESISQKNIDDVHKKTNKINEYRSVVKKINNYGVGVHGNFIFGFDYDTPKVFDNTLNEINSWDLVSAGFHILTPYPGTRLFNRLDEGGRILTKDWAKYDLSHAVFEPRNFPPEDLENSVQKMYAKFYSTSNVFERMCKNIRVGFHPCINTVKQLL